MMLLHTLLSRNTLGYSKFYLKRWCIFRVKKWFVAPKCSKSLTECSILFKIFIIIAYIIDHLNYQNPKLNFGVKNTIFTNLKMTNFSIFFKEILFISINFTCSKKHFVFDFFVLQFEILFSRNHYHDPLIFAFYKF